MPSILFRYILRDLLKVLAISTVVLVTVIAFGAALKPLGDGELGPIALLRYILLAMPPMLQFALPFSAAFSATIVYHRMTQDREIAACAGNGIAYHRLLLPAASLGVVLTIGLLVLANFISPFFWEAMERTARLAAPEYLARAVERGEPVRAGKTLIRVNRVTEIDPALINEVAPPDDANAPTVAPPRSNPEDTVLFLEGVIVAVREDGEIVSDAAASDGVFRLTRLEGRTVITSLLRDAVIYSHASETLIWTPEPRLGEHVLEDTFRTTPKFMNLRRLHEVTREPESFWKVREKVDALRVWLARRTVREGLSAMLAQTGRAVLTTRQLELPPGLLDEPTSGRPGGLGPADTAAPVAGATVTGREYVLYGGRLTPTMLDRSGVETAWIVEPAPGQSTVRLVQITQGQATQEIAAESVLIRPQMSALDLDPRLDLELHNAVSRDLRLQSGVETKQALMLVSSLTLRQPGIDAIEGYSIDALTTHPLAAGAPAEVFPLTVAIDREVMALRDSALSRIHERAALSVACLVMMLLGAVLAVRLQNALPLTVYFVSFVPAILALLATSAGADLVQSVEVSNAFGLSILWAGNAALAIGTLIVYRLVARN